MLENDFKHENIVGDENMLGNGFRHQNKMY